MKYLLIAIILIYSFSFADDVSLRSGYVIHNVQVIDTISSFVRIKRDENIIPIALSIISKIQSKELGSNKKSSVELFSEEVLNSFKKDTTLSGMNMFRGQNIPDIPLIVTLLSNKILNCTYLSSTDSTSTYRTSNSDVIVKKYVVLSIRKQDQDSDNHLFTSKIVIKKYKSLPLAFITVAGGIWAYTLFKDAQHYREGADFARSFDPYANVDDLRVKSDRSFWLGIGVSAVSLVFLVYALTPTETTIDQPVAILPTSHGARIVVHF